MHCLHQGEPIKPCRHLTIINTPETVQKPCDAQLYGAIGYSMWELRFHMVRPMLWLWREKKCSWDAVACLAPTSLRLIGAMYDWCSGDGVARLAAPPPLHLVSRQSHVRGTTCTTEVGLMLLVSCSSEPHRTVLSSLGVGLQGQRFGRGAVVAP
jgi:hypothetical protein